jgi:DNA polymerase V
LGVDISLIWDKLENGQIKGLQILKSHFLQKNLIIVLVSCIHNNPNKVMPHLPIHKTTINLFEAFTATELELPLISTAISAGFPSPALDFINQGIDLNRHLIKHPSSTFYGRVAGHSMKNAGIFDGDLLVIDKSIEAKNGSIAVCFIDGEFTLKRILIENGKCWLMPENEKYKPIPITVDSELLIWGVVTYVIKAL